MSETVWSEEHGNALRERRRRRGLTQEELAELAQVSVRTVRTLEQGAREPYISTIRLMAEALDCHPDDLLDKRVHPPSVPRAVGHVDDHRSGPRSDMSAEPALAEEPSLEILTVNGFQPRQRSARWWAMAGLALIVLILLAVGIWSIMDRSPILDPHLVAVAVFENRTGDSSLDPIGHQASEWIAKNLSESGLARAVTRAAALRAGTTSEGNGRAVDSKEAVLAVARAAEAGVVVSGAYSLDGDDLRMTVYIDDTRKAETIYAVPAVTAPRDESHAGVERLSDVALGALAAHFDAWVPHPRNARPPSFAAYLEYRAGLDRWRGCMAGAGSWQDLEQNLMLRLERAIELDPTWLSPRLSMVSFHWQHGHFAVADSCLAQIRHDRTFLTPYETLRVEAWTAILNLDYYASLRALRSLEKYAPESPVLQYVIAFAANYSNRPREALDALEKIDPAMLRDDPLIGRNAFLFRTTAYHALGDHERELETLQLLQEYYPGDPFAYGRDRFQVYAALGQVDKIYQTIDEYMTQPRSSLRHPGYHMGFAVVHLRAHGYREDAARIADRAVAFYLDRPADEARTTAHRWQLADCLYVAERFEEARRLYEELAAENPDELSLKGRQGTLAARRGDRQAAIRILEELLQLDRPYLSYSHTLWCARIAAQLGDRERSVALLREAVGQGASILDTGGYLYPCFDLEPLCGYEPYEELRRPKG